MSLNSSTNSILNNPQQQNVSPKTTQKMVAQGSHILPKTQNVAFNIEDPYSFIIKVAQKIRAKKLSDVLSYIAETISKEELNRLISCLQKKQQINSPTLEIEQKMYQLPTLKELLSKNLTATIRHQLLRENKKDSYDNINILGDSLLEYDLLEIPYKIVQSKYREPSPRNKEILAPDQQSERENLRQRQFQEQEDLYDRMSILGDSLREYNVTEILNDTNNKFQKPQHKRKEVISDEQKIQQDHLRHLQLDPQEALYDHIDLLGEATLELDQIGPSTSNYKRIEHQDEIHADATVSISSEASPQTSFGIRRSSKYLSQAQIAQLAKIRKLRYEHQDREYSQSYLLGESEPIKLKEKYSFRQPHTRLQSPRELVFKESVVNVKKNKDKHSKVLLLPVMNFPPPNWPTPVIPHVRQDLSKLRNEQREYFLSMQQAQVQKKSNQTQNGKESIAQGEMNNTNEEENLTLGHNKNRRNSIDLQDEENAFSIEDCHKVMNYLFLLLFVQWLLITGIVSLFKYHNPSNLWLESSGSLAWIYVLCTLNLVIISFIVFPATRYIYPINLAMLTLFTLLVAFLFSYIEVFYPNDAVLMALGCACGVCLVFALFFCQHKYSFTICRGLLLSGVIDLIVLVTFYLLVHVIILEIVYAAIAVSIYSSYLVFNTREILEEKSKFNIQLDNYILGAIHMNLDFIFITLEKIAGR